MNMQAGRELDALVAEKVMGLRGSPECWTEWPQYSTDIAAAWRVVEKLEDRFALFLNQWLDEKGFWDASFDLKDEDEEGYPSFDAEAETAPLAICRAALKAVGIDVA